MIFARITPNVVTIAAGIVGLGGAYAIGRGSVVLGLSLWLVSRALDAYDGLVARLSGGVTLFGGYLDITVDMLAYSAMASAFAFARPADQSLWLVVLVGYVMAITTTLALSSLAERGNRIIEGDRSLRFTTGLAEGGETTIVYILVGLLPTKSHAILWIWIALLALNVAGRTVLAFRRLR